MILNEGGAKRSLKNVQLEGDLVIVGGGVSGLCAAVTAARNNIKVILVQDRPVLGGNASSEIRLWILGATSHMGNNNRWAREGGVIDELLVENSYRNPQGNPVIFDTIMIEKVVNEPNIQLLLNTAVYEVEKQRDGMIENVKGFCSQNSTEYVLKAPLFMDASGDGILGFLSGAAFRMGAESKEEFGELFAPDAAYGELLGHSIYFYTKDTGKPVRFVPPAYALDDITKIPRFRSFNAADFGCKLWWIEYGGRLDTVHDTEKIKWELWKVVYGAWNYIKNSGEFPEAETLTLEWVGTIPGKRESRRFEGDYILRQQDIVSQQVFDDAVAFGGWSIDLHPADGVFSEGNGCNQWHSKGVYQIPYRCLYSKNIGNLFLAGRLISASHVAFGSTRVMATAAHASQAAAMGAVLCHQYGILPAEVGKAKMQELQEELLKTGHHIPGISLRPGNDLVQQASIRASSELVLTELAQKDLVRPLTASAAQMVPLPEGKPGLFIFHAVAEEETVLEVEFRTSSKSFNHTPDIVNERKRIHLHKNLNCIHIEFDVAMTGAAYAFITFLKNEKVSLHYSEQRMTGLLSVFNTINKSVSNFGKQVPPANIGMEEFEFWCPQRRPEGFNIAFKYPDGIHAFGATNIANGTDRPVSHPNAWVADLKDKNPVLFIDWQNPVSVSTIDIFFDTDYDHPMETVLMGHPETVMPFCVRNFRVKDDAGNTLAAIKENYHSRFRLQLENKIETRGLRIEVEHPSPDVPASVFSVRCF